ncbi:MAG: isocitrate lyase/phosphoenolpyruvate mutase family protein, partial [Terriglobales bacterium]
MPGKEDMSHIAVTFRGLHGNTTPLRLPNAWDAASARLFERLGAMAIATTSAGVAWALGYRDGRFLPVNEVIAAATRMARLLTVPLSVDIENGYSDDPRVVAD